MRRITIAPRSPLPSPSFAVIDTVIGEVAKVKYLGHVIANGMTDDVEMMRQRRQLHELGDLICTPLRCETYFVSLVLYLLASGTSLLRSLTGLGKCDLNGEVTLLQGVICIVEYNLGLRQCDCNGEVFLLVR